MNRLVTEISFGVKRFKQFRKKLVLDYKKGGKHAHRNPHAIPLELKQKLLKVNPTLPRLKKEEIGKPSENSKDKASLLTEDSQNMVNILPFRLRLPERQTTSLRYTKHRWFRASSIRRVLSTEIGVKNGVPSAEGKQAGFR